MLEPKERTCLDCEHVYLDLGDPGWSEYTPGGPGELTCMRGHFELDHAMITNHSWRAALKTAETCKDFTEYQHETPTTK